MIEVNTLYGLEIIEETQVCIKCGEEKPLDQFNSRSNSKNDIRNDCKQCQKDSAKIVKELKEHYPQPNIETHKCDCCGKSKNQIQGWNQNRINNNPFVLDHDHETGKFRGWICNPCNMGLSRFGDDPETLEKAKQYLTNPRRCGIIT